jgi:hypothetical protein
MPLTACMPARGPTSMTLPCQIPRARAPEAADVGYMNATNSAADRSPQNSLSAALLRPPLSPRTSQRHSRTVEEALALSDAGVGRIRRRDVQGRDRRISRQWSRRRAGRLFDWASPPFEVLGVDFARCRRAVMLRQAAPSGFARSRYRSGLGPVRSTQWGLTDLPRGEVAEPARNASLPPFE